MEEVKKNTKTSSTKKKSNGKSVKKKTSSNKNSNVVTSSIKKSSKKNEVNKESINKSLPKKENKLLDKFKKFISSYAFLYSLFFVLLICVLVLGIVVFVKRNESNNKAFNIAVPILEDGNRSAFNIDLAELKNREEYVLKVTNYRGDNINTESLDYSITIRNESGVIIKVTKDDQDDDLMVDPVATIIEGVGFGTDKKEEDIYHFTINDDSKIEKDAVVSVEIATQKRSS